MNIFCIVKRILISWWMMSFLICGILFFYNKNLSLALMAIFNGVTALCVLIFCLGFIEKIIESKENKCLFKKTWVYKNIPLLSISFFYFIYKKKNNINLIPNEIRSLYLWTYSIFILTNVFVLMAINS